MRNLSVVLIIAGMLTGCSGMEFKPDTEYTGASRDQLDPIDAKVTLQQRWSTRVGVGYDKQFINLVPAVSQGRVFVADRKGRVAAFDANTGTPAWQVDTDTVISAGPGVGEGLVLVGTSDAEVLALSAASGELLWKVRVSSEVLAVPRVYKGRIIVQIADGNIAALNAVNGNQIWVYDRSVPALTLRGTSSPAVELGLVLAGFSNGKLAAISAEKGFAVWESNVAIPGGRSELERMIDIDGDPIIAGNNAYVATFQGRVSAVDLQTGALGWKRDMSSHAGLGVDFSQVYVTDEESQVWALTRDSGSTVWKMDSLKGRNLTAPVPFNEFVAVGDSAGYLHLLTRHDGRVAARVKVDDKGIKAKPAVADDTLYVYGNGGKLGAFTLPPR